MSGGRIAAFLLAGAVTLHAPAVFAQSAGPPLPRFEAGLGALWMGRQPLGENTVTETTGAGGARPLFQSSSELSGASGLAGRLGVRVTGSLVAEGEASYGKPQLRIALSGDAESAAAVTAAETVQQFTIGGGLLWYVPVRTERLAPFAMAGGGYLRQLHEGATLIETGRFYQFGGGVSVLLLPGKRFHTEGVGARVDARAVIRSRGVAFDGGLKTSPAVGVSAFVRF